MQGEKRNGDDEIIPHLLQRFHKGQGHMSGKRGHRREDAERKKFLEVRKLFLKRFREEKFLESLKTFFQKGFQGRKVLEKGFLGERLFSKSFSPK
ncbi:MAG: hypothetical protein D6805_06015 [Planctomycetota bacterium]|nr:MAG: hypothetical protein D6805_06015 [Planctomycetota bacterium]